MYPHKKPKRVHINWLKERKKPKEVSLKTHVLAAFQNIKTFKDLDFGFSEKTISLYNVLNQFNI